MVIFVENVRNRNGEQLVEYSEYFNLFSSTEVKSIIDYILVEKDNLAHIISSVGSVILFTIS